MKQHFCVQIITMFTSNDDHDDDDDEMYWCTILPHRLPVPGASDSNKQENLQSADPHQGKSGPDDFQL